MSLDILDNFENEFLDLSVESEKLLNSLSNLEEFKVNEKDIKQYEKEYKKLGVDVNKEKEFVKYIKPPKNLHDFNRLTKNMLKMCEPHQHQHLKEKFEDIKQNFKDDRKNFGKDFNNTKELLSSYKNVYDEFNEITSLDVEPSEFQKFDVSSKNIENKSVVVKHKGQDTSIPKGELIVNSILNVRGKSEQDIKNAVTNMFDKDNAIDGISSQICGRLFNQSNKIKKFDDDINIDRTQEQRENGILLGVDYNNVYRELNVLKKKYEPIIGKTKVNKFIKNIKEQAKKKYQNTNKYYQEQKKIKEVLKENQLLKEQLKEQTELNTSKNNIDTPNNENKPKVDVVVKEDKKVVVDNPIVKTEEELKFDKQLEDNKNSELYKNHSGYKKFVDGMIKFNDEIFEDRQLEAFEEAQEEISIQEDKEYEKTRINNLNNVVDNVNSEAQEEISIQEDKEYEKTRINNLNNVVDNVNSEVQDEINKRLKEIEELNKKLVIPNDKRVEETKVEPTNKREKRVEEISLSERVERVENETKVDNNSLSQRLNKVEETNSINKNEIINIYENSGLSKHNLFEFEDETYFDNGSKKGIKVFDKLGNSTISKDEFEKIVKETIDIEIQEEKDTKKQQKNNHKGHEF